MYGNWTRYRVEIENTNHSMAYWDGSDWAYAYTDSNPFGGAFPYLGTSLEFMFGGPSRVFALDNVVMTPEPTSVALITLGGLMWMRRHGASA